MELTLAQQQDIGLPFVLDRLQPLSPLGRERKRALRPYARDELAPLQRELKNLGKAVALGEMPALDRFRQGLMQLRDIRTTVARLKERELDQVELFELKRYLMLLRGMAEDFETLQEIARWEGIALRDVPEALSILDPEGSGNPSFSLRDQWSCELATARREKREIEKQISHAAGGEREALLIRRTAVVLREETAEQKLCADLSKSLRPYGPAISHSLEALGHLDLLLAKAALAKELGGVQPILTDRELSLVNMVHPSMADSLQRQGVAFMPLSLALGPGAAVLTGANMGARACASRPWPSTCISSIAACFLSPGRLRSPSSISCAWFGGKGRTAGRAFPPSAESLWPRTPPPGPCRPASVWSSSMSSPGAPIRPRR